MRFLVALLAVGMIAVGCAPPEAEAPTTTQNQQPSLPPGGVAGGSTGDIAPMTPSQVPNAPVAGGTSLGEGGGSVGIAAKAKAKDVATGGGAGSLGSKPADPDSITDDDQ